MFWNEKVYSFSHDDRFILSHCIICNINIYTRTLAVVWNIIYIQAIHLDLVV